jgi:hypothetical protein
VVFPAADQDRFGAEDRLCEIADGQHALAFVQGFQGRRHRRMHPTGGGGGRKRVRFGSRRLLRLLSLGGIGFQVPASAWEQDEDE